MEGRDIVVGVDGTADCDAALMWAAGEAGRAGTRLVVVHAWQPRAVGFAPYARPRRGTGKEEPAREVLERAVLRARAAAPGVKVAGRIVRGRPEAVLRHEASGAALLVLGSAAHRAGDGRLGAVLLACLRWPPCPLVVVGAGHPVEPGACLPVAAAAC
ncbi:universal stress protein [Nonomuraea sp. MCN248]|uniref:Universal stress protein n=1 Tax=Nonomuraea corallina TaxID=2989783 RepID=A0ABT4SB78_9ACTN|nr:universal stress protein [Nonomuraea corallina]MDA0634200.1 universal stress protein [Nonomuraea corallina]